MSTRSYIAKQVGEDKYKGIYCHSDGYLSHNGALLIDIYNTPEKVDEILALGSLSYLAPKLYPDPSKPHSFDYDKRQEGVTVAYGRDRGETGIEAKEFDFEELLDNSSWCDYVYVFSEDNKWLYFRPWEEGHPFRDVETDLNKEYADFGVERLKDYYGFITDETISKCDPLSPESEITEQTME